MDTPKNGTSLDGLNFLEQLDAAIDGQKPSVEAHGDQAHLAKFGAELKVLLEANEGAAPQSAPENLRERLRLKEKKPASTVVKLDRKLSRFRLGILDIAALLAVSVLGVLIWNALKVPAPVSKGDPVPVNKGENNLAAEDGKGEPKKKDETAPLPKEKEQPVAEIQEEPWKTEIRRKLSKKVSFEFVETPLDEAIGFVRNLTPANFILDPKVAALGKDKEPITLRVQDMEMETALTWILKLAGLEFDLRNQAVFISTPENLQGDPELRIYDVSDLPVSVEFLNTLLRMEWHPDFKFDSDKVSMEVRKGKLVVLQKPSSHDVLDKALRKIRKGLAQGQIELAPIASDVEWKNRIRQSLQRKVTFEFVDTPLEEGVAFLRSLANVAIIVDPKVVAAGTPAINLRVKDMSLDLALEWVLKLADLEYDLRDNAIFIGKSVRRPTAVAYKVKLDGHPSLENIEQTLRAKFPKIWNGPRTIKIVDGWLLICQDENIQQEIQDWLKGIQPAIRDGLKGKQPEIQDGLKGKQPAADQQF